jgi:hypothetical protein
MGKVNLIFLRFFKPRKLFIYLEETLSKIFTKKDFF